MAEKESSATAKTALGLSIGGLGLELLQGMGGFPGLLGGLLGGRPGPYPGGPVPNLERENLELRDKIVGMEANNFTVNSLKDVYDKLNNQAIQLATIEQRDKDQRVIDGLQQQLTNCNITRVAEAATARMNCMDGRMNCMDTAIAGLRGDINSFSGRYVSANMITPPVAPAPNPGPVPLAPVFSPMQVAVLQGLADNALRGTTTTPDATSTTTGG
jgi:hypothetical protein